MATTEYTDTSFAVGSIQARTDPAGGAVVDVNGEELRLYASAFTPGVLGADHYPVAPGPGMSVEVGSGSPETDVAYVPGVVGQGTYVVRHELGTTNVAVPASDLANGRLDEVYVMIADDPYDSSTLALPRLALRVGDPSVSPVVPGPDPGWSASLLIATLAIAAGSTTVDVVDITDSRVTAGLALDLDATDFDGVLQPVFDAHVGDFDSLAAAYTAHVVDFDDHVVDAGNSFIPLAGGKVASTLEVSGDVNLATIRARANDIHFEDLGGADLFRWDDSIDQWEFKKNVTLEGNFLLSPANPTTASHVGDRGYNDGRYSLAAHTHTYLPLAGGTLTGDLTLPAGTAGNTVLKFGPMAANDGMYGDTNELSVSFDGQRKFSVFSTASGESANVVVRASTLVPFKIERQVAGGDAAFMMRFTQTGVGEVLLNMGALRWLADNHNTP